MVVNCEEVWREISNYLDGGVDAGLRTAMDEHFRGCKVGSSRVDLQACKLEYSIVSPK